MMRSLVFLALSVGSSRGFAPPTSQQSRLSCCPSAVTSISASCTGTRLYSTPEALATEGDWSAFLDTENTGYVYYFNTVTGESSWEKPTATFPTVDATATATSVAEGSSSTDGRSSSKEARKEERRAERKRRREERKKGQQLQADSSPAAAVSSGTGVGGFFGGLFGGSNKQAEEAGAGSDNQASAKSKKEQLSALQEMASNDKFLSELDSVIAEAEEAIAIADKVEEAPPQNKGGFFSSLGFVSGNEAIKEMESLVEDAEERTSNSFSLFGAGTAPKATAEKAAVTEEAEPKDEVLWVEGLKGLFQKTFNAFNPPQTTQTADQKVVAVETTAPKEKKAEVSSNDFLDVLWGAETSARPTLNIAEMMKAFQVEAKEEESDATTDATEEFRTLGLDMALAVKPHPEKAAWGGEDYGFTAGRTFGVFDGVSGATKEKGKKLYSRSLAESMKKSAGTDGQTTQELTVAMSTAKLEADDKATGASTAVVASVGQDNVLRALNLGDSVCLVIRDGAVAARTREIIHYFDCPYQLSDDSPDRPGDGTTLSAELFRRDVVVAGSDGVFDNLSDAEVCEIVAEFGPQTKANAIAKRIVERSRAVSLDPEAVTPYSTVARGKSGYPAYRDGRGGKVDDVSCVVVKTS